MPHLFVEQGRIQGTQLPLGPHATTIGRDKVCDICLPDGQDPKISRRHAVILCLDGQHYIKDGDGDGRASHNGTRVNGQSVVLPARKLLKDRDRIEIHGYVLIFRDDLPEPDANNPSTLILAPQDDSVAPLPPTDKLKKITELLRHSLELDALLPRVVELLLELFPRAERSFVILKDPQTGKTDQVRVHNVRHEEAAPRYPFNRKIVQECVAGRKALRSADPTGPRSAMCAPLASGDGEPFGVLLLDNASSSKGFSREDILLLEGMANHAATAFAIAWYHDQKVQLAEMEKQLALAADVVKRFLPERVPQLPCYEFFAAYEPVVEVGGDYYDFVPLPDGALGIVVADVAGHGWPAAVVMARFSAQVQACLRAENDLARALGLLNSLAQPLGLIEKFITMAVLKLDPATHAVNLVNAGHPPPLLLRRAAGTVEEMRLPDGPDPMLAVWDEYDYHCHRWQLQPGDRVILCSDGFDLAITADGIRPFGASGLSAAVKGRIASPKDLGEHILKTWDKFAAGCRPHDDITLVCFGRE